MMYVCVRVYVCMYVSMYVCVYVFGRMAGVRSMYVPV